VGRALGWSLHERALIYHQLPALTVRDQAVFGQAMEANRDLLFYRERKEERYQGQQS